MGFFSNMVDNVCNTFKGVVNTGMDIGKELINQTVARPLDAITRPFQDILGSLGMMPGGMMGNMMNPMMNQFMQSPLSALSGGAMGGLLGSLGQMNPSSNMLSSLASNLCGGMGGLNPLSQAHNNLSSFLPNIQSNLMNSFAHTHARSFDLNINISPQGVGMNMQKF
jgi:hypothetical protein